MQWSVPVFIGCVGVCFTLDQLKGGETGLCGKSVSVSCLGFTQRWILTLGKKLCKPVLSVDTYQRNRDTPNIKLNSCPAAILKSDTTAEASLYVTSSLCNTDMLTSFTFLLWTNIKTFKKNTGYFEMFLLNQPPIIHNINKVTALERTVQLCIPLAFKKTLFFQLPSVNH